MLGRKLATWIHYAGAGMRNPEKAYLNLLARYYEKRRLNLFKRHFVEGSKRDAVLLASYPKSGNTMFRFVWLNLINQMELHEEVIDFKLLDQYMPSDQYFSDLAAPWQFSSMPCLLKTHRPYADIFRPYRAVHLFRNPFDTMVSAYHYFSKRSGGPKSDNLSFVEESLFNSIPKFEGSLSEYVRKNIDDYFMHFVSWMNSGAMPIDYADLTSSKAVAVLEDIFARFSIPVEVRQIELALEMSDRRRVGKYPPSSKMAKLDGIGFVRDGSVGQWEGKLSEADFELIARKLEEYGLTSNKNLPPYYARQILWWSEIIESRSPITPNNLPGMAHPCAG